MCAKHCRNQQLWGFSSRAGRSRRGGCERWFRAVGVNGRCGRRSRPRSHPLSPQPAQTCEPPTRSKGLPGFPGHGSADTAAAERARKEEDSDDEVSVCRGS